ncbi:Acetyltransferase (GNAT) family protein [Paenibacillus sp. UNC496MF]|uniref:GNAT family N-acetyltransferase n=1 Tax=Paenibacillus sp. UNC496MF TaxID=1502753 RepID=UPI0008F1CDEE|nr:GNAT family N-acetyltransferase [Paenibacillus sp. UNC496MF]SFJ68476.1 Acetyltransferase (GNAT) family protein [Paenibacillus sp. UNC496MF]
MIEPISLTDPAAVRELLAVQRAAYRIEAELIGFDGIPGLRDTEASLAACGETFYGRYESGALAGAISFKTDAGTIDIHRLVVHPAQFRKGIGESLLRHALALYAGRAERFLVATGAANLPALRLYRKLGFAESRVFEPVPGLRIAELERRGGEPDAFDR